MTATTENRICLWSGPRNVSTALMYSFAQRPDCLVIDEPLYGHYLKVTEVQHPGQEQVMAHVNLDGPSIVEEICHHSYAKPVVFIKNMAHHLVDLDFAFLNHLNNFLLIRDPREMLPSIVKQIPNPVMRDTALKRQWEIYQILSDQNHGPLVVDSKDLLLNPSVMLEKICKKLGIAYYPEMTSWKAGPIPEDGIWAKYWYHSVHKSTGFQPYQAKEEPVPAHLLDLHEECQHYYQLLLSQALRVD